MKEKTVKYISVKKASGYLGIPLRTVYRLVEQGKIRSIRIGGKIRCLSRDVEKCAESGTDIDLVKAGRQDHRSDDREHSRINTGFNCRFSVILPSIKDLTGEGVIGNLSAGGIFIVVHESNMEDISVDDPIELEFSIIISDEETINATVKGRVVRKDEKGIAVKFRLIERSLKKRIAQYVG